jgi:hypothetical protein
MGYRFDPEIISEIVKKLCILLLGKKEDELREHIGRLNFILSVDEKRELKRKIAQKGKTVLGELIGLGLKI